MLLIDTLRPPLRQSRPSHALQPITAMIRPDRTKRTRKAVTAERNIEPVEKVRWQKLQEKWPPYLPFKRRSRIEKPFWYPHFGQFSVVRDFFYSLVRWITRDPMVRRLTIRVGASRI